MLVKLILSVIGVLLAIKIFQSLANGRVDWYGGESLSASKSTEPLAYWFLIAIEFALLLLVFWLVAF